MKKVLFIAYYFPPMGFGGVKRPLKFAKYLRNFGWDVTVLTCSPKKLLLVDDFLLNEAIESGIKIARTGEEIFDTNKIITKVPKDTFQPIKKYLSSWLFIPDSKILWYPKAIKKAFNLWKENNGYDLIFAVAPPFTDFLIGQELKRRFKVPLVVDFMDAWVGNYILRYYPTFYHKWKNIKLESSIVRDANKIITTNRRIKEMIISRNSDITYNDIKLYPHTFDAEDFELAKKKNLPYTTKMRITYAGSLHSRGLKLLFKSILSLFNAAPLYKNKIEFLYLGIVPKKLINIAKEYNILDNIYMPGYVNHLECIKYLLASDVLFLHIKNAKNNDAILPGVLGDYFGSRKNILACVPEGVTKNLLLKYNACKIVTDYNPASVAEAIYDYYNEYANKSLAAPNESFVQMFENMQYVESLARDFNYLQDIE
ncbi:MAG: hypothetical protein N2490_05685 [Ignavibacteria bacterium]|nr:hypothetical protein [Ignavibacteria bacterium]